MATGSSIAPRRQASSHGAAQTRAQTDASGLGPRAAWYASSNRPRARSPTYVPASVPTGQAVAQGTLRAYQSASRATARNVRPRGVGAGRGGAGLGGGRPAASRTGRVSLPAISSAARVRANTSPCHAAWTCARAAEASRAASPVAPSRRHAVAASKNDQGTSAGGVADACAPRIASTCPTRSRSRSRSATLRSCAARSTTAGRTRFSWPSAASFARSKRPSASSERPSR